MISALACLANNTDRFGLVVPIDQSFTENYAGIFRFRFWNYGEWTEVVVDDKLPTKNNRLIYCRNLKDTNEMFGPLLEKAYAKLNKCYSNLITGEIIDALIDLTGGVHENFKIKAISDGKVKNMNQEKLWNAIFSFFEMKSMAGCSIDAKDGKMEEVKANKLITGKFFCFKEFYNKQNWIHFTSRIYLFKLMLTRCSRRLRLFKKAKVDFDCEAQ